MDQSQTEFLRLYYGPLAIVESFDHATESVKDSTVERAMIIFKSCLDGEKQCNELGANLPRPEPCACAFLQESHARRSWGYKVKQLEGDYQEVALAYQKRLLTKRSNPKIAK